MICNVFGGMLNIAQLQLRHKLKCSILAMHIGAAIYRMHSRVIMCTAFNVLKDLWRLFYYSGEHLIN